MQKLRSVIVGLLAITLLPGTLGCIVISVSFDGTGKEVGPPSRVLSQAVSNLMTAVEPDLAFSSSQATITGPTVILRAASGATIRFKTQNDQTVGDVPPQTMDIPHLVLYRTWCSTAMGS